MPTIDQERLLEGLRRGDAAGLTGFIDAYGGYLHAIAARIAGGAAAREDIEECVADAIVRVWRSAGAIGSDLKAYAGAVARNAAIDLKRRRDREAAGPLDEGMAAERDDPPEAALSRERRLAVQEALLALDPSERDILIRRYYYDEPLRAIAAAHALTERAVEGRLRRSRKRLKDTLGGLVDG